MAAQPKPDPDAGFFSGNSYKTKSSKNKRSAIIKEEKEGKSTSSTPGARIVATEEGKKKVIISPADELDEDELPLSRSNWPALFLVLFLPTIIYLTFYVLGSLEII